MSTGPLAEESCSAFLRGSFRESGVPYLEVLITRILLLGSPLFGNSHILLLLPLGVGLGRRGPGPVCRGTAKSKKRHTKTTTRRALFLPSEFSFSVSKHWNWKRRSSPLSFSRLQRTGGLGPAPPSASASARRGRRPAEEASEAP